MNEITNILSQDLWRYKIKARLGKGGMATVFLAEDTNLHRDVAIKVLHGYLTDDETFRQRFEQEARFIAQLNHPNIVQVYDFDTIERPEHCIYYMVMRYVDGHTLVEVLDACRADHKTLSYTRIGAIMTDIAAALDYAHARGMVHRDIKPANILIEKDGAAILSDFGIARLAQDQPNQLTQDGSLVGTPAYMSPEQASGQPVDYRSDLYSLGVVLFELLTGQPPFKDDSTLRMLSLHIHQAPPAVSSIMASASEQLDGVLYRALAKNPAERYPSAQALVDALFNAFNSESPTRRDHRRTMPEMPVVDTQMLASPTTTLFQTIDTALVQPIRRNPMGFAAFVIALAALLLVARLTQTASLEGNAPPAAPPTAIADSMTGNDLFFSSDFGADDASMTYWIQSDDATLRTTVDRTAGVFRIENLMPNSAAVTLVDPAYTYDDLLITLTGSLDTASSGSATAFGIVFRYQDNDNYNVFAVDGRGRYSIWTREAGNWRELRNAEALWQPDDRINGIGEANTLMLAVEDDDIVASVNGVEVVNLTESTFADGHIGIYLASIDADGAIAVASIDHYSVMRPVADSMTGNSDDNPADSMTGD